MSPVNDYELKVFNRWGQLIFESNQLNEGWNGRTNSGTEVPEGTYYYTIEIEGETVPRQNFLTLWR